MMNHDIAIINTCDWGSTGKIAIGLQYYLKSRSIKALFCYGRGEIRDDEERFCFNNKIEVWMHYADKCITGRLNNFSKSATKRLISKLRKRGVKCIYIINLHGCIISEKYFFDYLIQDNINVVYIMADESAFLGNCTYRSGCDYYLYGCKQCRHLNIFQNMMWHASERSYILKQEAYRQIKNIIFVGPEYVVKCARTSPLMKSKDLQIVDEAIDVTTNRPVDSEDLRKELKISGDKIILVCVAPYSYPRKGVKYYVEAARKLENDDRFVFVNVGYDIKDKSGLPHNYIPVGYVNNQQKLTEFYSMADLFVFPSLQDTMPNACLEALACGTPLLCFNTSGMPYMADETVMSMVEPKNIDQMVDKILNTKKKNDEVIHTCRNYALNKFDNQKYFKKLITIMNSICNK